MQIKGKRSRRDNNNNNNNNNYQLTSSKSSLTLLEIDNFEILNLPSKIDSLKKVFLSLKSKKPFHN